MNLLKKTQALLYFLLNDISDKFDAHMLKTFVDNMFVFSEKIVIHFPRFLQWYVNYYCDIIEKEIKNTTISEDAIVLHIGCGSIPASSILIAKNTHASVHGIDKDVKAIKKAKLCIQKLGYESTLKVSTTDALTMDLSKYSHILISQGIRPKQQFLTKISRNISPQQCIILRSFSQDGSIDSSDLFLQKLYHIIDIIIHNNHGSTISIIMKKK